MHHPSFLVANKNNFQVNRGRLYTLVWYVDTSRTHSVSGLTLTGSAYNIPLFENWGIRV